MGNVVVNEEEIADMFDMCGIKELEIIIPILKKRIDRMLKKQIELIELFENDKELNKLKGFEKKIEFEYKTKERIEKLFKWCE